MPDLTLLRLLPGLLTGTQMWKGPFPLSGTSFGLTLMLAAVSGKACLGVCSIKGSHVH